MESLEFTSRSPSTRTGFRNNSSGPLEHKKCSHENAYIKKVKQNLASKVPKINKKNNDIRDPFWHFEAVRQASYFIWKKVKKRKIKSLE